MSEKNDALRLADMLERMPLGECDHQAAAKLRRQHEEITELRHGAGVAHQTIAGLVAQRDALLEALNMAVQWVEEYASQMRAYTTSEQANADLSVIYAAIKAVEEGE